MDSPSTLLNYYRRFFTKLWEDFLDWPRDNILIAGIAAVVPAVVVYLRNPNAAIDWGMLRTTLWVYLTLISVYTILQLIRVPWKIDRSVTEVLAKVEAEYVALLQQRKEFDEAKPNLVLREPGARHVQELSLNDGRVVILKAPFVKVRIVNRPSQHTATAIAHDVSAKIKFFDKVGQLVLEMDGRWDDKDQPSFRSPTQSKRDLLLTDFAIEEERNLDIAFLNPKSNEFVAMNNDNYNYQSFVKPEHALKGDYFKAEIRLVAINVDATYSVEFSTSGKNGGVRIIEETRG